jgi:hypothetical protein
MAQAAWPVGPAAFPLGPMAQAQNLAAQQRFAGRAEAEQQGQFGQQMQQQAQDTADEAP